MEEPVPDRIDPGKFQMKSTTARTRAKEYHMQIPPSSPPEEGTDIPSRVEAAGLADPVSVTSRRLDPKYTPILVPASMAVAMSLVLSLVQTIVRIWFVPNLMSVWLTSFAIGVIMAIPTVILVAPHAQRLCRPSHRRVAPLAAGESPIRGRHRLCVVITVFCGEKRRQQRRKVQTSSCSLRLH